MGRRKTRRNKTEDEYTELAIQVERYEAEADASINHEVYYPQHAFNLDDRDPVFRFITRIVIFGKATYPAARAGDAYELTIYGDDASIHFSRTDAMMMVQRTERVRATVMSVSALDCFLEAEFVSNARRVMTSILKSSEPIKLLLPRPLLPSR